MAGVCGGLGPRTSSEGAEEATALSVSLHLGRGERSGLWKVESPRGLIVHGSWRRPPHSDKCDGCSRWDQRSEFMSPDFGLMDSRS